MTSAPPEKPCRSFWGWCRCSFRWCRISLLALVLLTLLTLTWLRFVGLPDFIRLRLVAELRERGVNADFSSLHFHWFRGLVATDLQVSWAGTNGPRVSIAEADLDLAPPPWSESSEILRGLRVRRGSVTIPLLVSNEPPSEILIDQVAADLRFLPGDAWEIRQFGARTLGLNLQLRATLTNLAHLRTARSTPTPPAAAAAAAAQRIRIARAVVDELALWSSPAPPRAEISLHLDGRQPEAAHGDAYISVPEVRTPHGDVRHLRLSLRIHPPNDLQPGQARSAVTADFDEIQTPHGGLARVAARVAFMGPPRPALPTNATWQITADHVFLRGFRTRELSISGTNDLLAAPAGMARADLENVPLATRLTARARTLEAGMLRGEPITALAPVLHLDARHPLFDPLRPRLDSQPPDAPRPPTFATLTAHFDSVTGTPGSTGPVSIQGAVQLRPAPVAPPPAPENLAWWSDLWPFTGSITSRIAQVRSPQLNIETLDLAADWSPPLARISRLDATLGGGTAKMTADLDVPTRAARVHLDSDFDLHVIDPLLNPKARENFNRYQWQHPPWLNAEAWATLPPWNDPEPDWAGTVKPTLRANASVRVDSGSFKGVPFDSAQSSLAFDGVHIRLGDLVTTRPEGTQHVAVEYNTDTQEYRVDGRGPIQPQVLRPLIGEKSAEVLDLFTFQDPVEATVSVWGPWSEGTSQSIAGKVLATNLTFRGHRFDRLETTVLYTNRSLVAAPARIHRDAGILVVDGTRYDLDSDLLQLTNAVNTIDPAVITAAISPEFPEKLRHYRFDTPPTVRVDGTIHPRAPGSANLAFDIQGGPFHFWRFSADRIASHLLWQGHNLTLTNLDASFYKGSLRGDAAFDLADPDDGRYRFSARIRNADLGALLTEATEGKSRTTQGTFDLNLDIGSARTSDLWTWNGDGRADLRDGLLWDVPIFGFLSPILNGAVPGLNLGNNRAKHAEATFTVTNGVFHTRDLTIACSPANLLYRGTIDLDQRVNAKVEAEVLGNIAGFGPIFGLVLKPLTKLLEFRVTGTLSSFEAEPLYVPKFLLFPLQPLKVIREIFHPGAPPRTNAPPVSPGP